MGACIRVVVRNNEELICSVHAFDCVTLHNLQSDIGRSQSSSNRATMRAPTSGNIQLPMEPKMTTSSYGRVRRSRSDIELSLMHDGYSVRSVCLAHIMFVIVLHVYTYLDHDQHASWKF